MKTLFLRSAFVPLILAGLAGCSDSAREDAGACVSVLKDGFREFPDDPSLRFLGKVEEDTARCRGGDRAVSYRDTPWVDWSNYWSTGDISTRQDSSGPLTPLGEHLKADGRGLDGSLMDLEYQRIELIKFNLIDNHTREAMVKGRKGEAGVNLTQWPEMHLDPDHPHYDDVGGDSGYQECRGQLVRYRTLTGICNDVFNPKTGATGTLFARNAAFEATFPRLQKNELARNRHSDPENGLRIGLLKPDPQLISRELFSREQSDPERCAKGLGTDCDYLQAPFFNVLAAFWIQFMTHDWFSHTREGRNRPEQAPVGCDGDAARTGCRPQDRRELILTAESGDPPTFTHGDKTYQKRAHTTTENLVTAWWDASQIYGYDEVSAARVLRDPEDAARLWQPDGYLPGFSECRPDCPIQPIWEGQEAAAFPANWSIGMSFYHNLFVREHNYFVDAFRAMQREHPERDSGLRDPDKPTAVISYSGASDEEIFQAARLVVSAEIAKIHTIEWTTQLLYGEPLFLGMNSNWFGLFNVEESGFLRFLSGIVGRDENVLSRYASRFASRLGEEGGKDEDNAIYSVFASGAGIFGLRNKQEEGMLWWKEDTWDITNPKHLNAGVNHFGAPFNFPEEFTTVYRLHPLLPDLIELRDYRRANEILGTMPVADTARGGATAPMRDRGLENWALSMGRQRLGALHLQNHPLFLQNLPMPHLGGADAKLDIPALDLVRDRERGVPRFNEFRRQIGLKSLSSFDDFVDVREGPKLIPVAQQKAVVDKLRAIYGQHRCDASKVITDVQRYDSNGDDTIDERDDFINDCLGHPDGTVVDNVEDVDMVVGWLAEYTRPHGFAISETQFHIFILNASRRLFSDRFFTSSFRPEFYSQLGYDWVINNGPLDECPYPLESIKWRGEACLEPEQSNGHTVEVSPLKRLMLRTMPELRDELMPVVNVFDPWARDRGEYYSLEWKPRPDAARDPAFAK